MALNNQMTVSQLIDTYNEKHPDTYMFDKDTMKFFGESKKTMRVLKTKKTVKTYSGKTHECWVLRTLQKKNPSGPKTKDHYFDVETFDRILGPED